MKSAPFGLIEDVADAVMFEGYVLYPYRASTVKNRFRWQFGVVAPRVSGEAVPEAPSHVQTECVVEPGEHSFLNVKVRCLRLQRRTIEQWVDEANDWRPCDRVAIEGFMSKAGDSSHCSILQRMQRALRNPV